MPGRAVPTSRVSHRRRKEAVDCASKKRAKFFKRLFTSIETEMLVHKKLDGDEDVVSREGAVLWKFQQLDADKSKVGTAGKRQGTGAGEA